MGHTLSLAGVDVTSSSATKEFPLGTMVEVDGTTYQYVYSTSGCTQYLAYVIDEDGDTAALTYAAGGSGAVPSSVGVAQSTISATNYGWLARKGTMTVTVLASCAKDVKLYTTATAGKLDDASASQSILPGLRIDTTDGGSGSAISGVAATFLYIN